jgi:hypothetical protein
VAEHVSGVYLTEDELRAVASLVRMGCVVVEERNGTLSARNAKLRDQLAMFARRTSFAQVSDVREPANLSSGPDPAPSCLTASTGSDVSVAVAARRTGYSLQHVRRLCRHGDLIAWRAPSGTWLIDSDSAAALAASRGRTASA